MSFQDAFQVSIGFSHISLVRFSQDRLRSLNSLVRLDILADIDLR